ncbi:MAG: phosphatidylserine/phosphatidylglycerophosphate/cardiolipin synthase family protein [Pseudomonadota bacterium]|nr:phosphatidylserine/phosphatidylglycerophosphate/cardiolipin synthase family protein [Pseudomonadota bacterium]
MPLPSPEDCSLTVDGNRLTLLTEGPARLEALLALIDEAEHSVRVLYYIFMGDEAGEQVRAALLNAVDRGVKVSLLIDGFGSSKTPDTYFKQLHEKGARFCRFNPSYGRRYLLRNHQKLALADDRIVLIGGFNVERDYFGTAGDGAWRDIGLIVEGPAAERLGCYFDALMGWALHKGARLKALRAVIRHFSEKEGKLQWQFGGPMQRKSPWALSTVQDLANARNLEMIAAYFAPMTSMLVRIARVASTGGRVRVITASKSDNRATIDAARYTYARLLKRQVKMFEYLPTKLHSKLLVMDDIVHIGSSNFDIRSLYLNMEMMLRVDDPKFAMMMRGYFEHEIGDSEEITPRLHKARGTWFERLRWRLGFFLVNSLDFTVTRQLARPER